MMYVYDDLFLSRIMISFDISTYRHIRNTPMYISMAVVRRLSMAAHPLQHLQDMVVFTSYPRPDLHPPWDLLSSLVLQILPYFRGLFCIHVQAKIQFDA